MASELANCSEHNSATDVEQENKNNTSSQPNVDPYSYTKLGEFTSEMFKIEVTNLPKYYGLAQFKKLLHNQLKLAPHKLKPVPARGRGKDIIFVTFQDEHARQLALKTLNGFHWKKSCLSVRLASAAADPYMMQQSKRALQSSHSRRITEDVPANKRIKFDEDSRSPEERLRDAVVPWWNIPYDQQLAKKSAAVESALSEYKRELRKLNFSAFRWLCVKNDNVHVQPTQASPITNKYRNKCEFTVGVHPDSDERVVGFRLASYKAGSVAVVSPIALPHITDCMQRVVAAFERHVRSSSLPPFDPRSHTGYWRQLLVRCTRTRQLLLLVQFHPQQLSEDRLQAEQQQLVDFFRTTHFLPDSTAESCDDGSFTIGSLHWQNVAARRAGSQSAIKLIAGTECVEERLCGLRVLVSPTAFLQINTPAAELLYSTIADMAACGDPRVTLFDVCCGTGTIAMTVASRAMGDNEDGASQDDNVLPRRISRVVGIELVSAAVSDARLNARLNNVDQCCQFYAGRAEKLLPLLLQQHSAGGEVVAVVDPPRAGLGRQVSLALRRCLAVKRVVYVACDVRQSLNNLLELARPESRQYRGAPFVVRRVASVDLFPHTPHVEVVFLLERYIDSTAGNDGNGDGNDVGNDGDVGGNDDGNGDKEGNDDGNEGNGDGNDVGNDGDVGGNDDGNGDKEGNDDGNEGNGVGEDGNGVCKDGNDGNGVGGNDGNDDGNSGNGVGGNDGNGVCKDGTDGNGGGNDGNDGNGVCKDGNDGNGVCKDGNSENDD